MSVLSLDDLAVSEADSAMICAVVNTSTAQIGAAVLVIASLRGWSQKQAVTILFKAIAVSLAVVLNSEIENTLTFEDMAERVGKEAALIAHHIAINTRKQ